MEDVLDLYAETHDPKRPVVCFDESPTQLIGELREPIPVTAGRPRRYDYEYRRNGTVNLFVFLDAHRSWRKVKVTDQRTAQDFAECTRDLVDVNYPRADLIRVVMDNDPHSRRCRRPFPRPEQRDYVRFVRRGHRVLHRVRSSCCQRSSLWARCPSNLLFRLIEQSMPWSASR
jgi:DDE superfamily endonuclease